MISFHHAKVACVVGQVIDPVFASSTTGPSSADQRLGLNNGLTRPGTITDSHFGLPDTFLIFFELRLIEMFLMNLNRFELFVDLGLIGWYGSHAATSSYRRI